MKVLITGVAGFIGSRLAEALLHHGHEVVGVDNLTTGLRANVPLGVTLVERDIREWVPSGKWDLVYHCAASYHDKNNWERDASTNVLGTINVVREAQRSDAKIIYFQTSLCYGPNPQSPIRGDAPLAPVGSYAVSKTAGENYIRDSGLPWVSLRLANMYGPRNLSGPIPTFWKRLKEGQPCVVVDSRRDFVFVDDLVWVAVKAGKSGEGPFNVSSGTDFSIREVYLALARAMDLDVPEPEITPRGKDDVATLLLDPEWTFRTWGWVAKTPLADGVKRAVEWYEAHGVKQTFTHLAQKG